MARRASPARTAKRTSTASRPDVYQTVTDRIIAMLDAGVAPWHKPWQTSARFGSAYDGTAPAWFPRSAVSNRPYRGINTWLLLSAGYGDPRWITFRQALNLGGAVRKGEHGTKIVLWKETRRKVEDEKTGEEKLRRSLFATEFTVFNIEQTEGVNLPPVPQVAPPTMEERHGAAEKLAVAYLFAPGGPGGVAHMGDRAYYSPAMDAITLPPKGAFDSFDAYFTTLFHEMGHSTGHKARLDRGFDTSRSFGDHSYSREELVAEFTASFLAALSGIERTIDNSAAYLQSWARELKADPKMLISAASQAQKAADLILSFAEADAPSPEEGAEADLTEAVAA